jgi:RimJ/RimL family protein N-acetyltransferase
MHTGKLKDATEVTLAPVTRNDVEKCQAFFSELSPHDRLYLRFDMTRPEVVRRLIEHAESSDTVRLLASAGADVVGYGVLEVSGLSWHRHVGEIRVIVHEEYRRRHLGARIVGYLFKEAKERELEKVIIKMAAPQIAARKIADRLGFAVDAVLPNHIKDADGELQSLVVMSTSLDQVSQALRDFYKASDWPDG